MRIRPLHPRIILWGHPRCRSTAFERAMVEREDFAVLHEPLSKVRYFGETATTMLSALAELAEGSVSAKLLDTLALGKSARGLFVKDFPYHCLDQILQTPLWQFTHVFLVREPRATISSFHNVHPAFREDEVGYSELLQLLLHVKKKLKAPPLVIEADALALHPEAVFRDFCSSCEIDFSSTMLRWRAERRIPAWDSWKGFHDRALQTTSIEPPSPPRSALPEHRERLIKELEPLYGRILSEGYSIRSTIAIS